MANGHMGRKVSVETRERALGLLAKGCAVPQVATRLGVSQSVVRNWIRDSKKQSRYDGGKGGA